MKHNKWNKYLKIACSWILIFSMCFLSLNTVNASAEDTTAFESESETGDTEAFTSDTEISDTEIESEPSTDQVTSESEETKQETEKQIPDSIEVAQLNAEIQNRVVNGEVPSTDRVEYVDVNGNSIENAPKTIELGTIADHKVLAITGKNYEFKSARVNGKDCVYIGKYNDTVYYSTDGVIAIKLDAGQKLTMTYQEYYNIRVNEEIPEGGVAGIITTKAGTVKVNTADTIRVNAGETWKFTVKPGTANKVRYKIGSVTATDASTSIKRVSGDEYEAYYEANFQKDDTVTIAYDKNGVYRVTINTKDNNGFEYINIEHSKENGWDYLPEQHKLVWTYTEDKVKYDGSIDVPKFHIKRGYRLVHMALNGETVAAASSNKEVPDGVGPDKGVKGHAGELIVNAEITKQYTKNNNEKDCGFEYSFNVQCKDGGRRDFNFNLAPYQTGQQVLTVRLKTDNRRSGEGIDVVMWDPDQKKLVPMRDNDTVNMDPVGEGVVTLKKRQVRIFFAKPKPGYRFAGVGVESAQPSGGVNTDGGKSRAAVDDLNNMNATSLGKKGEFKVYDEIWEAAKNAASSAGYEKFLAYAGEKTTHDTDWELYAGYFMSTKESVYVHYNSGAGEGVLPADAVVKNIPYNEELDTVKKKPMQSYGENPNTYEGKRGMGSTFRIGEEWPEPTCEGYEFLGWKLRLKPFFGPPQYSEKLYQHNEVFNISEENYEFAANRDLPVSVRDNEVGYQIVAQWKKIDTKKVEVKHWLKVPNSTKKLGKTTAGTISFATENESVNAYAKPEANGTFPGYVFDTEDPQNELEKEVKNDSSSDTITLNLYYKPTVLTVRKTVTGYNMEPNRSYEFTIKVVPPSGTDASTATITDGQIFIKKGTDDKVNNLTFTNNKATFNLAKDEFVDISCLPTGWTYIVTETDPGKNYKTSYKLNGSNATDGKTAEIITSTTGNDEVTFTNTSTVAPPETGRTFHDSEWILLLIVVLFISAGGMTFLRKMKKRY